MRKLFLLIFLTGIILGQSPGLSHGLGFAAGMPSGVGFSYRQMNENHGFQLTVGALAFNNNYDENDYFYGDDTPRPIPTDWIPEPSYTQRSDGNDNFWGNIGLTYYKPLHRADKSLFYGFGAASAYYTSERYIERKYIYFQESETTYSYKPEGNKKELRETELDLFFGIGLGLTYNITNNIRFSLELPLTVSDERQIWMIIPQGGLHYYFK